MIDDAGPGNLLFRILLKYLYGIWSGACTDSDLHLWTLDIALQLRLQHNSASQMLQTDYPSVDLFSDFANIEQQPDFALVDP
jgi:hypothetical protein